MATSFDRVRPKRSIPAWYTQEDSQLFVGYLMAVQTKEEILDLIRQHEGEMRRLAVRRCGLFGSFVRNEAQDQHSDVDILVEFEPGKKTFDHFIELAFLLEDLFGRKVDLVTTDSLSPYIGPWILREVEYASLGS